MVYRYFIYLFIIVAFIFLFNKCDLNANITLKLLTIPALIFAAEKFYMRNWELNENLKRVIFEIASVIILAVVLYLPFSFIHLDDIVAVNNDSLIEISETIPVQPTVPEASEFTSPEDIKNEIEHSNESQFIPVITSEKLNVIFLENYLNISKCPNEADKIELLREHVKTNIQNKIGIECNADFKELNNNEEYTSLIQKVNKLEVSNIEDYINLIEMREKAYSIGKTRELCLLLARDHYELGILYDKNNVRQEAFNYYSKAIEYYYESFSLMKNDGTYKYKIEDIAYIQGQVYHSLGDIKYLDKALRQKSYFMALAFYEISCDREKNDMYSYYYSGMINHKLAIFENENRFIYLLNAEKYYTKALDFSLKNITKKNLYIYLSQIYYELASFSNNYGDQGPMLPIRTYQQKKELMIKNIEDLETVQNSQI